VEGVEKGDSEGREGNYLIALNAAIGTNEKKNGVGGNREVPQG